MYIQKYKSIKSAKEGIIKEFEICDKQNDDKLEVTLTEIIETETGKPPNRSEIQNYKAQIIGDDKDWNKIIQIVLTMKNKTTN